MGSKKKQQMMDKVDSNQKETEKAYDEYRNRLKAESDAKTIERKLININHPIHWVIKILITIVLAIVFTMIIRTTSITPPSFQAIFVILLTAISSNVSFNMYDEFIAQRTKVDNDETDIIKEEFEILKDQYKELKRVNEQQKRSVDELKSTISSIEKVANDSYSETYAFKKHVGETEETYDNDTERE